MQPAHPTETRSVLAISLLDERLLSGGEIATTGEVQERRSRNDMTGGVIARSALSATRQSAFHVIARSVLSATRQSQPMRGASPAAKGTS